MAELIIVGAGAIGRGFLPWLFDPSRYDLVFVDVDPGVIGRLRAAGRYTTYRVRGEDLESREIPVAAAFLPGDAGLRSLEEPVAAFVNVGPRSAAEAARVLEGLPCPVVLCENDPDTVPAVRAATGLERVYFAIPDVITSSTAPSELLARDPLSVVTEAGTLFMDDRVTGLEGDVRLLPARDLLHTQWTAKLYLHNTPHALAAYLGAYAGVTYVHEAMAIPEIEEIVSGAMEEMLASLKVRWDIPHDFLDWYAGKELARFRSRLLHDPIRRVAREPLRKLEAGGRLTGAAQICLSLGFVPKNILIGIASAILFEDETDPDRHIAFMRAALPREAFIANVLGLRRGEALDLLLRERLDSFVERLQGVPRFPRSSEP